jgi:hypothetical protein
MTTACAVSLLQLSTATHVYLVDLPALCAHNPTSALEPVFSRLFARRSTAEVAASGSHCPLMVGFSCTGDLRNLRNTLSPPLTCLDW